MGHAIKHIKKRNIKFEKEEKEFTFNALTAGFNRFPSYCDIFQETHLTLLSGNGPLPEANRHFIARMACKAAGCESLTKMEEQCFLKTGGNATWLEDTSSVPAKLRRFEALSLLMKKSSTFINSKHIKRLTEGTDSWTLAEIVQALVIIVYFHGLSSFPIGTKINQPTTNDSSVNRAKTGQKLRKISENFDPIEENNPDGFSKFTEKELKRKRSFSEGEVLSKITKQFLTKDICDINDPERKTENSDNTIRIQDYCWDDQGFSVLSTFYSDIAVLLDDKFRAARKLSPKNDQTHNENEKFRTAVWNFVQCIFGVQHDDYNYKEINEALDDDLKDFIKLSCNNSSNSINDVLLNEVRNSARGFVSILVMEARLQSELLYVLKAVMKHMS
jgi:sestrin